MMTILQCKFIVCAINDGYVLLKLLIVLMCVLTWGSVDLGVPQICASEGGKDGLNEH